MASEPALDIVGALRARDRSRELVVIGEAGQEQRFADATPGLPLRYVCLARRTPGYRRNVRSTRRRLGQRPRVGGGRPGAGASPNWPQATPESGIPFGFGLVRTFVGRTFIQPTNTIRQLGIRLKLNPLREVIAGSGWSSTLDRAWQHQRALIRMLREAGPPSARISSPGGGPASTASISPPAPS